MKRRINPNTQKEFKRWDTNHLGLVFYGYSTKRRGKNGYMHEDWVTVEEAKRRNARVASKNKETRKTKWGQINALIADIKCRTNKGDIPFNLDADYLMSIATEECPIFNTPFVWGRKGEGVTDESPSLDRVIPELGYVKGNVVFISNIANRIKNNATEDQLYAIADWLHETRKEVLGAFKDELARLSEERARKSEKQSQLGTIHGAGTGQDCDGSHHHRGESEGQDACDSTEESCRICMGARGEELGALEWSEMRASYGNSGESDESIAKRLGCICNKFGKRGVASGQLAFEGF